MLCLRRHQIICYDWTTKWTYCTTIIANLAVLMDAAQDLSHHVSLLPRNTRRLFDCACINILLPQAQGGAGILRQSRSLAPCLSATLNDASERGPGPRRSRFTSESTLGVITSHSIPPP